MEKTNTNVCFITNDVETTSLWNHCLSDKTGEKVLKEGMPRLLEAYKEFGVKSTFFFTGYIAKLFPEVVRMIMPYGHEVGCHGLTHESDKAFDRLSLNDQVAHLSESKKILEDISGKQVISFRAPALRVNSFTPKALEKTGFLIDSSVAPQRLDMFLSFGAKAKLKWLFAPRSPYFTKTDNLARKGDSNILEIPVSSFGVPYTGTVMRISPTLLNITRCFLSFESMVFKRPLLFLIHPNELINEEIVIKNIKRRSNSYVGYLLGDKLRYNLKLKNLGAAAQPLLKEQLSYLKNKNYSFQTLENYYQTFVYK